MRAALRRIDEQQQVVTNNNPGNVGNVNVPGEHEFKNKGVAYCPHCDGPLFKGKRVAVIGGGNSGVEAAIDLAGVVGHVTLLEFDGRLRADEVLQRKLRSLPNVDILMSTLTTEVLGDAAGNVQTAPQQTVRTLVFVPDNTPPTVTMTSPAAGPVGAPGRRARPHRRPRSPMHETSLFRAPSTPLSACSVRRNPKDFRLVKLERLESAEKQALKLDSGPR